jgi:hypothetical protein
MQAFTATAFQRNPADIFNAVQSDGFAIVNNKSRPTMVLMLETEQMALLEKIKQLTDLAKASKAKYGAEKFATLAPKDSFCIDGDSKDQLDMLKG